MAYFHREALETFVEVKFGNAIHVQEKISMKACEDVVT